MKVYISYAENNYNKYIKLTRLIRNTPVTFINENFLLLSMLTHKFRLYPNKKQEEKLLWTLDKCRQTYNFLLEELQQQKIIDKAQIQGLLPDMKICEPELKQVYSKTLQYECYRLFSNLRALSQSKKNKRKVGKLRFKGKNWFKTFTYNQSGFKLIKTGKRCQTLQLSKIGNISIRCHRNIKGKIKQITIKKEASGKWFASIIEERSEIINKKPIEKIIGMEDLQINNMVHNKYLSKSILDASWGKLRQLISYKAERAGKLYISVNHKGTTQRCSQCGNKVRKELWNRKHKCPFCNFIAPRDYNSALEIKRLCLQKIGQELSKSTLVKMEALPLQRQLLSMKQEAL